MRRPRLPPDDRAETIDDAPLTVLVRPPRGDRLTGFGVVLLLAGTLVSLLIAVATFVIDGSEGSDTRNIALTVAVTGGALLAVRRWGVWALAAVPIVIGPLWLGDTQPMVGDEPDYLIVAESVVHDHDLAIANNYQTPPFSSLSKTHLGWNRTTNSPSEYSVHQPGVGILVAPGWGIAERRGALAIIGGVTALLVWEMFSLARAFGADRPQALTAVALVYLAPAVIVYGQVVFSEIVVALALTHVARVLRSITQPATAKTHGRRLLVTASIACASMPWIHLRYVLPTAILAGVIGLRGRRVVSWAPAAALALSGLLVVVAYQRWYGAALPSAPYGPGYDHEGLPSLRSVVGLLVDGHVGLLFAAPIALVALLGTPLMARVDQVWTATIGGAAAAYFVVAAGWSGWWLGTSTPGRNWTPLLPLLVPFIARLLREVSRRATIALTTAAIALAMVFVAFPLSAYPDGPGVTTIWVRMHLDSLAPTFRPDIGRSPLAVGVVLVLLSAGAVALGMAWVSRRPSSAGRAPSP
jgi:hypothetical protein